MKRDLVREWFGDVGSLSHAHAVILDVDQVKEFVNAEMHSKTYRRVETVAKIGDTLRVLDLIDPMVREEVAKANDAKSLYEGAFANDL